MNIVEERHRGRGRTDYFFHFHYDLDGVCDGEFIDYGPLSDYFRNQVVDSLVFIADLFFDQLWEYFDLNDVSDWEGILTLEECDTLELRGPEEVIDPFDILSKVIYERSRQVRLQDATDVIFSLMNVVDQFLNSMTDHRSYCSVKLLCAEDFFPYFFDHLHWCRNNGMHKSLFGVIGTRLDHMSELCATGAYLDNDIIYGRFLEWVDMYSEVIE